MEEAQVAEVLSSLEQALSGIGLLPLVMQERLSAIEGKAERLTNREMDEFSRRESRSAAGRPLRVRAEDVRLRPLTTRERLATLLDLVEAAVGGTYAIEVNFRNNLKSALDESVAWNGRVVFADPPESELTGLVPGEWILPDQKVLEQRRASVREVVQLVNRLREQAQLTRSDRLQSDTGTNGEDVDGKSPGDWS